MSVIEQMINGLESLKGAPPTALVDTLIKFHEQGLKSLPNSEQTLKVLSNTLLSKPHKDGLSAWLKSAPGGAAAEHGDQVYTDPFPDFSNDEVSRSESLPQLADVAKGRDSIAQLLEQVLVSYQELLANYNRDFDDIQARRRQHEQQSDDEIIKRMRDVQLLLLKYPIAGQALFAALIRQGRDFAKTEKGAALKSQLEKSPMVAKARTLFEGVTGGMLAEQNGELPSTYVDGFLEALDRDLEDVLSELGGVDDAL